MDIEYRKRDHIRISLERDVSYRKTTWLEWVELIHDAAPELDPEDVDTSTTFLGRRFNAPVLIEGMTGGTGEAEKINANLAEAASTFGVPMGVGSQRAGIVRPETARTFRVVRDKAPDGFIIGNIGGSQLVEHGVEMAVKAVEMIEADALAVHLNPLQELVQPDGRPRFRGLLKTLKRLRSQLGVPIILKEIGMGISGAVAARAEDVYDAVDVAGSGGTNWTLIEMLRASETEHREKVLLAETLLEWGIPTAAALMEVRTRTRKPVIASGGLRTGLDAAKAISLGADMAGLAHPFLEPATRTAEDVLEKLRTIHRELASVMFLTGCRTVQDLKRSPVVVRGPLLEWASQRCPRHPKIYSWQKMKRSSEPLSRRQKPNRSN
ncbi:Isopentenyl-diphosphate delta-isomerase [archaeon HR01]|nr:Isopentenyl-diphosphate delta-isomerase [archaeon HR01]